MGRVRNVFFCNNLFSKVSLGTLFTYETVDASLAHVLFRQVETLSDLTSLIEGTSRAPKSTSRSHREATTFSMH